MNKIIFNGAIGDTVCITSVLNRQYIKTGNKTELYTNFPEIFHNNPYVISSNFRQNFECNLQPCTVYSCNIVKYYTSQLDLPYDDLIKNKIYLTPDEINIAKYHFESFSNDKKIIVCLYSSADSKDLRYDYMIDFLLKIKKTGVKLIFFGTKIPDDKHNIFDKTIVGEYGTNLRNLFALMNECDLYIGVDTGLFHIANALEIPQIVFFRNNGCINNCYHDTFAIDSNITCPPVCCVPYLGVCHERHRCLDNFNMDEYFNIAQKFL